MGVGFIFIISLMHTLSDKIRFVQRKLKPAEVFMTKKWMVLAEHLLAQAHIYIYDLVPKSVQEKRTEVLENKVDRM